MASLEDRDCQDLKIEAKMEQERLEQERLEREKKLRGQSWTALVVFALQPMHRTPKA